MAANTRETRAELARLEGLRDSWNRTATESQTRADAAYRLALGQASVDGGDPEPLFDEAARLRDESEQAHRCYVQLSGIEIPKVQLALEQALILELEQQADALRIESADSRAAAVAAIQATGQSEITLDFTGHESQRLHERALALERRILALRGDPAMPGGRNATGLIKLKQDVEHMRRVAEKELYGTD